MVRFTLVAAALAIFLSISSCGGGTGNHGMLQSITVTPSSPSSSAQFVATGTYADGTKSKPLDVEWYIWDQSSLDPVPSYVLTRAPFAWQCGGVTGSFLVTAFAPQAPSAPTTGPIVGAVWADLVTDTQQSEGGFVAGYAHLNCP